MLNLQISVSGMTCQGCAKRVATELEKIGSAASVVVDPVAGSAMLATPEWISRSVLQSAIERAGYKMTAVAAEGETCIPVQGMHCGGCARRVSEALAAVGAQVTGEIDPASGRVNVLGSFDAVALVSAIEALGYTVDGGGSVASSAEAADSSAVSDLPGDAPDNASTSAAANASENHVILAIDGMTCASCVASVERALAATAGTRDAQVNYADESASVVGTASVDALIAAVEAAGYHASVRDNDSIEGRQEQLAVNLRRAWRQSGVALAAGTVLMADMWLMVLPGLEVIGFWIPVGLVILGVMVYSGGHFYRGAVNAARHLQATMDTLIALGTGTAWLYSMLVLIMPALLPEASRHVFFEAGVFILGFVGLGKALEANAKGQASLAVRKLLDLQPAMALRITNGEQELVPLAQIVPGDELYIKPGATVPVDGVVVQGASSVDEAMLTGESLPVDKTVGSRLVAGTLNQFSTLTMRAEHVGSDTVLANIVRLVRKAQNSKPQIARMTDQIAAVFVPIVIVIALLAAVVWGVFVPGGGIEYAVVTCMSVLIVACPCALGLAVPMSIMVGVGRAANVGLLFKNSDALQAASKLTTIVVDKTGTLTLGKPTVTEFNALQGNDVLGIAYSLERQSEHPLAAAIVTYCEEHAAKVREVADFAISPGGGVSGTMDGKRVAAGNHAYMLEQGMVRDLTEREDSQTRVYIGSEDQVLGEFALSDELKPDTQAAVARLQSLNLKVIMLTGDNPRVAEKVAKSLSLDGFIASVAPDQKLAHIHKLQAQGERVGMVGDGINDALALSAADVGFAMGHGSDVALESADVALLGNSMMGVSRAITLSRASLRNIRENLLGAFAYNVLLIPIAAGVLYPVLGVLLNPVFASIAMAASSITVVVNASRLRFVRL